jgi:hypothetical protein
VNSETEEILEIMIPEGTPPEKEDDIIREEFDDWVWDNIDSYYDILDE